MLIATQIQQLKCKNEKDVGAYSAYPTIRFWKYLTQG